MAVECGALRSAYHRRSTGGKWLFYSVSRRRCDQAGKFYNSDTVK